MLDKKMPGFSCLKKPATVAIQDNRAVEFKDMGPIPDTKAAVFLIKAKNKYSLVLTF